MVKSGEKIEVSIEKQDQIVRLSNAGEFLFAKEGRIGQSISQKTGLLLFSGPAQEERPVLERAQHIQKLIIVLRHGQIATDSVKPEATVFHFGNFGQRIHAFSGQSFGKSGKQVRLWFAGEVHDDRTIQILLKVVGDEIDIFESGLYEVYGSDAMELFPDIFDVEIKSDVVLTQILHLEERGVYFAVVVVEYHHLPQVLPLTVDSLQKGTLLCDQV